jgi:hypothetical protein
MNNIPLNDSQKLCAYQLENCNYLADTRDHIPSLSLINPDDRSKAKFIIVDSCSVCNHSFSKDEEFFRNMVATFAAERSEVANKLLNSKVRRSIEKRPAVGHSLLKYMKLVNVFTHSGIFVGKRTKIEVPKEDLSRIFNVMNKYVKGLAATEFGLPLPADYIIRHSWTDEFDPQFKNEEVMKTIKWNNDNGETFIFGFTRLPNSFESIWVFIFYKKIIFLSAILKADSDRAKLWPQNSIRVRPNPLDI